jgi:hypothetical protein
MRCKENFIARRLAAARFDVARTYLVASALKLGLTT